MLLDLAQHLALHQVPVAQLAVLRPGHHVRVVVRQRRVHLVLGVLVARVVREQLPRLLVQQADRAVQCGLLIAVPTPTLTNTARFKVQGSRLRFKVQGSVSGARFDRARSRLRTCTPPHVRPRHVHAWSGQRNREQPPTPAPAPFFVVLCSHGVGLLLVVYWRRGCTACRVRSRPR